MYWTNHTTVSFQDYFKDVPEHHELEQLIGWNLPFQCEDEACKEDFMTQFHTWTTNTNVWINAHVYGMLYHAACPDCDPIVLFQGNISHPHRIVQDTACYDHIHVITAVAQDISEQTGSIGDIIVWASEQREILHWGCLGNGIVNIVVISFLLSIGFMIICCMTVFHKQYIYRPIDDDKNEP